MSEPPTPHDVRRDHGVVVVEASDGPSGDARIDDALATLARSTQHFVDGQADDASDIVDAGSDLHDRLQQRLAEAQT